MSPALSDAEVAQLLDDTVAASKEQLLQIKSAHDAAQRVTVERDALQAKVTSLTKENANLSVQATSKAASTGSIPVSVCNGIAEALVSRSLLSGDKQASFAANLARDPSLIKFAFEKVAERIPLTVIAQGSAFADAGAQFQAGARDSSGTPWM
jgi:hypothetical protein